jgi:hypothetical protein
MWLLRVDKSGERAHFRQMVVCEPTLSAVIDSVTDGLVRGGHSEQVLVGTSPPSAHRSTALASRDVYRS